MQFKNSQGLVEPLRVWYVWLFLANTANGIDLKMGLKKDYFVVRLPAGVYIYLQQTADTKSKDMIEIIVTQAADGVN